MALSISASELANFFTKATTAIVENGTAKSAKMLNLVDKVEGDPEGPSQQVVVTSSSGVGTFTEGGAMPTPDGVAPVRCTNDYGNYAAAMKISNKQLTKWRNLSDERKLVRIFQEVGREKILGLLNLINTHMLSGSGPSSNQILGLDSWIQASNTVGGVDRSVYTNFGCYNKAASAAVSVTLLDDVVDWLHSTGMSSTIDMGRFIWAMGQTQYGKTRALSGVKQDVATNIVGPMANVLGVTEVAHQGHPVLRFPNYTAALAHFFNLDAYRLHYMTPELMPSVEQSLGNALEATGQLEQLTGDVDSVGYGELAGIPIRVISVQESGDSMTIYMVAYLQSQLLNPRHNAALLSALS